VADLVGHIRIRLKVRGFTRGHSGFNGHVEVLLSLLERGLFAPSPASYVDLLFLAISADIRFPAVSWSAGLGTAGTQSG